MLALVGLLACQGAVPGGEGRPRVGEAPQEVEDAFVPEPDGVTVETWVDGLEIPWSLVFLPDGRALVSERPGRIRLIAGGELRGEPYAVLDVAHFGEGGLMGLALHPGFPEPPHLYAMYTARKGRDVVNRVVRLTHRGDHADSEEVLLDGIPGGRVHNGGRIAFGPDGKLYITTGDVWRPEVAQDPDSLAGKILRLTPEGGVPEDNPFPGSEVWTLGHRNAQGLAWHPDTGDLFSSEHGPSGELGLRHRDIVNVIRRGANYGWPRVVGAVGDPDYEDPLVMWTPAVPPGGMAFWEGDLFVATLRSEALVRIGLERRDGDWRVALIERWFARDATNGAHGRLRDAAVGPDGALYVLTSNRDGRGRVRPGDDRILRLSR